MKSVIKLGALALVLAVSIVACNPPKTNSTQNPDSVAASTTTKIIDTVKKDTAGKVLETKKDSTVTTTTKKHTPGQN